MTFSTLPTIHSNGTGAEKLRDDALNCRSLLESATDGILQSEFNARDYHLVDGAWEKARDERHGLMEALREASDHFMAVAQKAQDHLDEREARRAK